MDEGLSVFDKMTKEELARVKASIARAKAADCKMIVPKKSTECAEYNEKGKRVKLYV